MISIITITKSDLAGLKLTYKSLLRQTSFSFEWIVVISEDDQSFAYLQQLKPPFPITPIYQPPRGIYPAMNAGWDSVNHDLCLFLNSGDTLFLNNAVERINSLHINSPLIYFDAIETSIRPEDGSISHFYKRAKPFSKLRYGMPTHHQSIIYSKNVFQDVFYDESFRIAGDYEFTSKCYLIAGNAQYVPFPLSNFTLGGISQSSNQYFVLHEILKVKRRYHNYSFSSCMAFSIYHFFLAFLRYRLTPFYNLLRSRKSSCTLCFRPLQRKHSYLTFCPHCNIAFSSSSGFDYSSFSHQDHSDPIWDTFSKRDLNILTRLYPDIPLNSRILEIGPGSGSLLRALKSRGFSNLSFVELNTHHASLLVSQGFTNLVDSNYDGDLIPYSDIIRNFDFIIMNHSLEHFSSPLDTLNFLVSLRKGLKLVLFQTNFQSSTAMLLGRFWSGWQLNHHNIHFTPQFFNTYFSQKVNYELYWLNYEPTPRFNFSSIPKFFIRTLIKIGLLRVPDAFCVTIDT